MDLDGDGNLDVISGSYWPGDLYWFRGLGSDKYAAGETLKDAAGQALNAGKAWKDKKTPDMNSLASAPNAVDWDGDGDFDMLVGNITGGVVLIPNEGSRNEPKFSASERVALAAGGQAIRVAGGDAGPVTADWDGDGIFDLLVGAGDGSVWFYRNTGSAKAPELAAGVALIGVAKRVEGALAEDELPAHPGMRAKVHVTDWNGDGQADLLVGDFHSLQRPQPELSAEQVAKRDVLRAEVKALQADYSKAAKAQAAKAQAAGGEADGQSEELKQLQTKLGAKHGELRPLESQHGWAGNVWLYLRRPAAGSPGR